MSIIFHPNETLLRIGYFYITEIFSDLFNRVVKFFKIADTDEDRKITPTEFFIQLPKLEHFLKKPAATANDSAKESSNDRFNMCNDQLNIIDRYDL